MSGITRYGSEFKPAEENFVNTFDFSVTLVS